MKLVLNELEIKKFIKENKKSLVFFSNRDEKCEEIRQSINNINDKYIGINAVEVNTEKCSQIKEIESRYDVYTLPITIFFIDGKEVFRASKYVQFDEMEKDIEKYL